MIKKYDRFSIGIISAIAWFVMLSFLLSAGLASAADRKPVSPTEIETLDGVSAPNFSLKDLKGKTVSFSGFKGKVVILNFWASWCPPCVAEMPSFKKIYSEMKSRGLEVIAVSSDRSARDTRDFVENKGLDFTVLMDEDRNVSREYKVFSLPTTFLINRNGIIVEKFFGEYDWTDREMKKKIERLL